VEVGTVVLDVAFVLVAVAFFKEQLNLAKNAAIGCAFIVSMIVGLVNVAAETWPTASPWIYGVVGVIVIFLSAAGSFDLVVDVAKKINQARAPAQRG
jgi:uncharacterized membrane protein